MIAVRLWPIRPEGGCISVWEFVPDVNRYSRRPFFSYSPRDRSWYSPMQVGADKPEVKGLLLRAIVGIVDRSVSSPTTRCSKYKGCCV